jgi:hypothetical protein
MKTETNKTFTAFYGQKLLASGPLSEVALALLSELNKRTNGTTLVFDDETGNPVELDLQGTAAEVAARYTDHPVSDPLAPASSEEAPATPVRGRPRLGVIAREVTLLPEHWIWLASQPGGASVALRKLVHEARKANVERDQQRRAHERAYRAMSALAGNLPGFEESSRALFAGDLDRLAELAHAWPADIRNYIVRLATSDAAQATG